MKKLYNDEFAATINWLLIIVETIFVIHLVIFFSAYFRVGQALATLFVLLAMIFLAMLFFFATYKIVHFLEVYSFAHGKLTKEQVKDLKKKVNKPNK